MNRGTRRMWARRVLRAGWLIAPVMQVPSKVWTFFFGTRESTYWTLFLGFCVAGVSSCTVHQNHLSDPATGADIQATLNGNACLIDLMPRRQAIDLKGGPITYRDLLIAEQDCKEYWEKAGLVKAQKAAMQKVGAK